jgi:hypothetical protein
MTSRSEITTQQWSKVEPERRRSYTRNASISTRARAMLRRYDSAVELFEALGIGYEDIPDVGIRICALARKLQEEADQRPKS